MARPKDLPSLLQSWATGTYGAGPAWGGTPQRATPGITFFTPAVSLPAENENYLYGNSFDAVQAAINAVGQIPALNWGPSLPVGVATNCIAWSEVEQAWYAFVNGGTATQRTVDFGRSWAASTAVAATTAAVIDVAFDTAGNACMASGLAIQTAPFVSFGTGLVWTNFAGALGALGGANGIVYEPSSATWCAIGGTNAGAAWVYTSTNRTTWTARSLPGTWTGAGANFESIGVGNGLIVATYFNGATTSSFRTAISANGGVTWTNDQAITQNAGITLPAGYGATPPVWSSTDALWYLAVAQGSTRKTQVFSSPDGITWTSAATLLTNDCRFVTLKCIGSLLIALNDDGRIFCSFNKGVNWFRCGATITPSSDPRYLTKASGNGILSALGSNAVATQRIGLPLTAA